MLAGVASWLFGPLQGEDGPASGGDGTSDLIDLQCGKRVFNDVPVKMRTELWLSQLQRERGKGAAAIAKYPMLVSAPLSEDVLAEIEKDTHRTFPGHRWLKTRAGQLAMLRVLRAYAALDPEVGYSQGMNFIAGLMLTYLDEADAFGALTFVMQDRGLRDLYKPNGMALLQVRLWQLGRLMPPRLAAHLEANSVLPVLYASSWLLTCFAADFPLPFAARVMDLVITDCYAAPLMKVAVHILERCSEKLLEMNDMEDMVGLMRQEVPRWPRAVQMDMLTEALGRPWSARQMAVLEEINGAETVAEAVTRVDAAVIAAAAGGGEGGGGLAPVLEEEERPGSSDGGGGQHPALTRSTTTPGTPTTPVTPKTAAKLVALPPPPTSRTDKVDWDTWRPETPALTSVPGTSTRIEAELQEAELDPALSKALSTYASAACVAKDGDNKKEKEEKGKEKEQHQQPLVREEKAGVEAHAEAGVGDILRRTVPPTPLIVAPNSTAPPIPSPFQSINSSSDGAVSSMNGSSSAGFSDFASAPSANTGSTSATSGNGGGGGGGGGAQPGLDTWGTSANYSVTQLLAGLTVKSSAGSAPLTMPVVQETAGYTGQPAMHAMNSMLQPGSSEWQGAEWHAAAAPALSGLPSTEDSSSTLQAASSKAVLLQQAHLKEFLASSKSPKAGEKR